MKQERHWRNSWAELKITLMSIIAGILLVQFKSAPLAMHRIWMNLSMPYRNVSLQNAFGSPSFLPTGVAEC